jgi:hypothetical protein
LSEEPNGIEGLITAGMAIGVGVILAKVAENFVNSPSGFGLYDFASQQKKDDQRAIATKGPEGQKCSGHCEGPCTSNQCLDSTCGKLIPCSSHTHQHHQPSNTHPNTNLCTGRCKTGSCDSQGFCIDDGCGSVIKNDSCKKENKHRGSGKCVKDSCDGQFCLDSQSFEVIAFPVLQLP